MCTSTRYLHYNTSGQARKTLVLHLTYSRSGLVNMLDKSILSGLRFILTRSTLTGGIETVEKLAAADGTATGLSLRSKCS